MSKYSVTRIYAGSPSAARCGIALASAFALSMSGCDSGGPDIINQPGQSDDLSDSRILYREGGVVLSKSASDELADFVAETQFDAVLPMTVRLNAMDVTARQGFLKQLESAQRDVEAAAAVVKNAGDNVAQGDLARLDAANRRIENLMRLLLREEEQQRSRERATRLIEKYPILAEMSRDQIKRALMRATASAPKTRLDAGLPYSVEGDTSSGDTCRTECGIQYILEFATTEIVTIGALLGCSFWGVGSIGCYGWALAAQWSAIATSTYAVYTCTKRCG